MLTADEPMNSALPSSTAQEHQPSLQAQINALKADITTLKVVQEQRSDALLDEIASLQSGVDSGDTYESFSSMGVAASKVYHSSDFLSIGGYGEYKYKKYTAFKNYAQAQANETRKLGEFNIVRFVPYIGFKFNDWIIMNTEIEFEDGGAKTIDDGKNYKYAIVEFSYLDFLFDEAYNLRVGHILVPMGLINLNHEPIAFLTTDRPMVETFIIPSTWHTNGAFLHGKVASFEYYAGVITSPDAGRFQQGRYIQQGRLGARQFTDDLSFVSRIDFTHNALQVGASLLIGSTTALKEARPGVSSSDANATLTNMMAEMHLQYKAHGVLVQALAVAGRLRGDAIALSTADNMISKRVQGAYLTAGYDLFHVASTAQNLYGVVEIEALDMDGDAVTAVPQNHRFNEYTTGLAYYPDSKVVIKADYKVRDYASGAKLADEQSVTLAAGFIF